MPERQTMPGDVTGGPGTDGAENGSGTVDQGTSGVSSAEPSEQGGSAPDTTRSDPSQHADEPVGRAQAPDDAGDADGGDDESPGDATREQAAGTASEGPESEQVTEPVKGSPQPPTPEPPVDEGPTVPSSVQAQPAPAGVPSEEATQVFARPATDPERDDRAPADEPATEQLPVAPDDDEPRDDGPGPGPADADQKPRRRRPLLLVACLLGVLAVLYAGDLLLTSGSVPRGVSVAGIELGGLSMADAEQRLRSEIGAHTSQPIAVTVGEARSEIDPATAGMSVDWAATLDRVGSQPLNPITRITSFFVQHEVAVATDVDEQALTAALEQMAPVVNRPPTEGSVRFEGTTPVPVEPGPGQQLDVQAAAATLQREWVGGGPVVLPLTELPPTTTAEDVTTAIEEVARPAVSAPVTVSGEDGVTATLTPEVIAGALTFRAENEQLVPELNRAAITEALTPQLAPSEIPGRDATIDFSSGSPVVVPSQDGRGVDYEATIAELLPTLTGTGPREIAAVYADQPAELTTDELKSLGIQGVISEFTTRGFAVDSGKNIKRAAEQIDGMVVQPGETFSLNEATNPRDAAHGYVKAGVIVDGHPAKGIGGGVSQLATTLYNASYFAGMVDVQHREHSFYISRYPEGREATVYEDIIDVKFRNNTETGVLIDTIWTPESITVRLYGTKVYEVTSTRGPRTDITTPNTITIPAGEPCSPSNGGNGFTITDTRTLRNIRTGEVREETRTVTYNPSPIVKCGG